MGTRSHAGIGLLTSFVTLLARVVCEKEFFIDNLLVRIHFIVGMIRWAGLAQWEFELSFPSSLTSTFLGFRDTSGQSGVCLDSSIAPTGQTCDVFFSSLLLPSLELSNTKVYAIPHALMTIARQGSRLRACGYVLELWFKIQGSGFRVDGSGFRV